VLHQREPTKPASKNFLQQQARFDQFISTFNQERPHEALNVRYPAELCSPSPRSYNGLPELERSRKATVILPVTRRVTGDGTPPVPLARTAVAPAPTNAPAR
jgi:hypothetical protein